MRCPWTRAGEYLLISGVEYRLDESGSWTRLELSDPRAYDPMPEMPAREGGPPAYGKYKVNEAPSHA